MPKELQLRKRLLDVQLRVADDQSEVYSTRAVKVGTSNGAVCITGYMCVCVIRR